MTASDDAALPSHSRRRLLRAVGSVASGLVGLFAAESWVSAANRGGSNSIPGAAATRPNRSAVRVPIARMRRAFRFESAVIVSDDRPVASLRRTIHPRARYVGVVPGTTFSRRKYLQFVSLLRAVLYDRCLELVDGGFVRTGPATSKASWVLTGTLFDGTRLCAPAVGHHRWAENGKCIHAKVDWLPSDTTGTLVDAFRSACGSLGVDSQWD